MILPISNYRVIVPAMNSSMANSILNQEYTLLLTPRSPFARRVRLALRRLGASVVEEFVDPFKPSATFLERNPLGMVPVLVPEGAAPIVDSPIIIDYLDEVSGGLVWPKSNPDRLLSRNLSSIAMGAMGAGVNYFMETTKPHPDSETMEEQVGNAARSLDFLNREVSAQRGLFVTRAGQITQTGWDLGVALEYVTFRCPQVKWNHHRVLVDHLDQCRLDLDFTKTTPSA